MKKVILIILIMIVFSGILQSQNKAAIKKENITRLFSWHQHLPAHPPLSSVYRPYNEINSNFFLFLTQLPEIPLKSGKAAVFSGNFSFQDILEQGFESVNSSLISDNDDNGIELFSEAPFLLKIKCVIRL